MTTLRPTGEDLFTENDFDYIPGASLFFKVDNKDAYSASLPLNGIPNNPEDYLRSVQLEASNCPDVVVVSMDSQKMKTTPSCTPTTLLKSVLPGCEYAPTKSWCDQQIKNFIHARQQYISHLAKLKSINRQSKRRPKLPVYPLPTWDDEDNWKYFCLGNKLVPLAPNSSNTIEHVDYTVDDSNDADDFSNNFSLGVEESSCRRDGVEGTGAGDGGIGVGTDRAIDLSTLEDGFQPMLRILLRMEVKQIQSNLAYQAEWLRTYGFSSNLGRWIYALMACLEKPLYPSVISTLRELSRYCAQARTQVVPGGEEMNGLNLIICVVGMYFDQSDLLDPL